MRILTKEEFKLESDSLLKKITEGFIFIYPTDTIYGIGCNALMTEAVKKVRKIKGRHDKPFSIIAPSKDWIFENCEVTGDAEEWIYKLPGPYTLILRMRNKECIASAVNSGLDTLGVRIPDHWFSDIVAELGIPLISTSANVTGEDFMVSLEDLDTNIKAQVDFIVYEGEKQGKPSTLVDLTKEKVGMKER